MLKNKSKFFRIVSFYTSLLLVVFAFLIVLISFISDYQKYKSSEKNLIQTHETQVKDTLKWEVEHYIELINNSKNSYETSKREMLRRRVYKAHFIMQGLYKKYKDTKSIQEIQEIVIAVLRKVRFPNNGYYFIENLQGEKVLFDIQPELEGKNFLDFYNSDGVYVIKNALEFIKKEREGFFEYKWLKPDTQGKEINKISYIKLFEPFGWVIGTGLYEDDLQEIIQEDVLSNIERMKFDKTNKNYIFIARWDGVSLTYPAKGKNMYDVQDKNGKYIVRELIQKAKDGGGFVSYVMPSLKDERTHNKLSYVQGIPEWQWYVGAGLYVDDILEDIDAKKQEMYDDFKRTLILTALLTLIVLLIFFAVLKNLSGRIQKDFMLFIDFFNHLVEKGESIDITKIRFEEFEDMALYANKMLSNKIALEDNLKKYKMIVSATEDFLALVDKNSVYKAVNNTYLKYFNKTQEELINKNAREIFGDKEYEKNIKPFKQRVLKGEVISHEQWIDFPIGRRYLQLQFFPYIEEGQEEINYFVVTGKDITEKKKGEEALSLWQKVFENTVEAVMICDKYMNIITVNQAFSDITGYSRDELITEKSNLINHGSMINADVESIFSFVQKYGSWSGEIKNRRKNGEIYPMLFSASSLLDEAGNFINFIAIFSDVSRLKKTQEEVKFLSNYDSLTKLPNRVLLQDRITHAIENAKREDNMLAICFLDLDNFKKVNDSYGHTYGDDVIAQTASRIKHLLREADTLSRIGGDEFIILLENLQDVIEIENVVNKIQKSFENPFIINEKQFFLTASIGISQFPKHGKNAETLIKNADIAMYKAKNSGKNTYRFYTSDMSSKTYEEIDTENALKAAIKQEEFVVFYQPQVNLKTDKVIGFEALVRWKHPTRGLLVPLEFISLAENTKMIISIGEFVLKQACMDLCILEDKYGFEGRVSVNVSGIQIEHSDFLSTLKKVIDQTGIQPHRLELEITESVLMKDPKSWIEILASIRALGIKIAIDDFGTGYSSLSYLRRLPIDKLKIDMSFVRDIPHAEDACAIANSIINLSDSMKMTTLAEGIETKEQEEYLREHACEEGQGYLYSKPIDFDNVKKWLKNR